MPIIFVSAQADVPTTVRTLKKGAVNFLTKPIAGDDLLGAIHESLTKDTENRNRHIERNSIKKRIDNLTPREREVMIYVIAGMLNKQIAAELAISEETVKIHRSRVMKKLAVVSIADLVRLCEKAGIEPGKSCNK
jgi:RNA polymerase sigma factor (sigma-70 family)